jgi:arsenate reductase (thioredoxin)
MKRSIVFVCIGNACRSQMAEGWARQILGKDFDVYSAGSRPAGFVAPDAITAMKEIGINITQQTSTGLDDLPAVTFDAIVSMGCGIACPHVPAKQRIEWNIPDPIGEPLEFFRQVRDQIKSEIEQLKSHL